MKRLFRFIVVLAAMIFMSCASKSATKISKGDKAVRMNPDVVSGKLTNGMSYYVFKNKTPKNRISLRLVVKVGSIVEEENQLGVAHLIEHMAFNGTEHFEKNSLIDYAELIGMDFGAEVNAYTSFEETVYQLDVPADDPAFLETALLIFKDWASAVTFDQEELDKERGVVTEEWRGRLGLNGRLVDTILPFELADSEYVGHLPIGSMDVIANITRDEIIEFYKKWYRPEIMSVIVTGDINPEKVEALVKDTMSGIPASSKKITPVRGYVPPRTEKDMIVFADPEMTYTQVQLFAKDENHKPLTTEGDLKSYYLWYIVSSVLNMRLNEITANPESPWLAANAINSTETNTTTFKGAMFVPKDGCFEASFQQMLEEIDRLLLFGVTETEFKREKDSIHSSEKNWYAKRDTIRSSERADSLVNYCVNGVMFVSDDDYIQMSERVLKSIKIEDVNKYAHDIFAGRGNMCMIFTPSSVAPTLPSKEEVIGFWENYKSESLAEYQDNIAEGELMARPEKRADVVSKRNIEGLGITEYILSNGIRILTAKSSSEKSRINMEALSMGGACLVSDEEWMSCSLSPTYAIYSGIAGLDVNQLEKYLSNKNLGLNVIVNEHSEEIYGNTSPDSLECLLQLTVLLMTEPQFTDQGWYYTNMLVEQQAKNYGVQPSDYFYSEVMKYIYNDSIRYIPITPEKAAMLNREDAERLYKERFCNPADFTFLFYGDFNERELVDMCRFYLGNLKTDTTVNEKEKVTYEPYVIPAGVTTKTYKKGQENQGQVVITFGGILPETESAEQNFKETEILNQLRSLVDIKLREIIREDKSGSYGVSVYSALYGKNKRTYEFTIYFGCEPAREKELAKEVIDVLNDLRENLVDQVYIDKLKETYRRSLETNRQDADWCMNLIQEAEVFNVSPEDPDPLFEEITKSLTTAESMREAARKYLDTSNYFCGFLEPEK